ncbi:MAG TPA: hypothetical protein VJQ81_07520 [Reyranella sp.]|nr:hypothetical protein [Reyranella sp.]
MATSRRILSKAERVIVSAIKQLAVYGDVAWQHEVSTGGFRGRAFNGGVRYSF